ncbi:VOC family protein [Corynebacterium sp.]|uniref:VOC family protein n=1 Tax=Corynebacterium sp. TaxID=1720 RepID=UPI0026DB3CB8|nr:VOC family protein [Corynebacterium sp.]MDO5076439.1 VOC family protein [Corynebacterium sp.]
MDNTPTNKIDYVEFPARSIAELTETRDFFSDVFGWNYAMYGDDFADTADSGTFSGVNAENPAPATLAVVHVADLQATYEKVTAAGGAITREIFKFPGGRRFHFRDPAGNELAAWSE